MFITYLKGPTYLFDKKFNNFIHKFFYYYYDTLIVIIINMFNVLFLYCLYATNI